MNKSVDIIDIFDEDIIFDDKKENKNIGITKQEQPKTIIKIEKKPIPTNDIDVELKGIRKKIREDEKSRQKILEEARKDIDIHSMKLVELNDKIKNAELLKVKYQTLVNEYKKLRNICKLKVEEYNKVSAELVELRKTSTEIEKKNTMLKSILELLIKEYSIYDVCEITRLTEEKIKEYLN